ncbi:MAG: hypothetical protein K2M12_03080 [Muribaculaceae bacterium]|nr:hypothetical protein [Muribaculaceae bacterium]
MRNFTLTALCVLAICGTATARPAKSPAATKAAKAVKLMAKKHKAEAKAPWLPLKYTEFGGEVATDEGSTEVVWEELETVEFTYANNGQPATVRTSDPFGGVTLETNTYNDNGMLATRLVTVSEDGEDFTNSQKLAREYDPRLTSVITFNDQYMWFNSQWQPANCYKRIIERNADGNITSCTIATYFNGQFDPSRKIEIEYGADGKASKITETELSYDGENYFWVTDCVYSDIEWERTDGQIYSTENLMFDANRISKATVALGDGEATMTMQFSYPGEGDDYDCTGTMVVDDENISLIAQYREFENGGYKLYNLEDYGYYAEAITEIEKYDEFGLMTLRTVEWTDFTYQEWEEYIEGMVELDPETGYPAEYIMQYRDTDEESPSYGEAIPFIKRAYEGQSGISEIAAGEAEADAPAEYYNLQGIRVAQPAAGTLVIRRRGTTVDKIIVK